MINKKRKKQQQQQQHHHQQQQPKNNQKKQPPPPTPPPTTKKKPPDESVATHNVPVQNDLRLLLMVLVTELNRKIELEVDSLRVLGVADEIDNLVLSLQLRVENQQVVVDLLINTSL
jgi:hypothetical protein